MLCPFKFDVKDCQRALKCLTSGEPECADAGSGMTIKDWLRTFDEKS